MDRGRVRGKEEESQNRQGGGEGGREGGREGLVIDVWDGAGSKDAWINGGGRSERRTPRKRGMEGEWCDVCAEECGLRKGEQGTTRFSCSWFRLLFPVTWMWLHPGSLDCITPSVNMYEFIKPQSIPVTTYILAYTPWSAVGNVSLNAHSLPVVLILIVSLPLFSILSPVFFFSFSVQLPLASF